MNTDASTQSEAEVQSSSFVSRRTLIRVGWTAPLIMSVAPAVAFAASGGTRTVTQSVGGTTTSQTPPTTTTVTTPTSTTGDKDSGVSGASGGVVPEQQSAGPQPARINRGFTG